MNQPTVSKHWRKRSAGILRAIQKLIKSA